MSSKVKDEVLGAHSRIGASSMERWSNCPGSVRLSANIPSTSSVYADEGTLAHEHAAYRLEKGVWRADISDEMREHLEVYVNEVLQDLETDEDPRDDFLVEQKFNLKAVYPGLFGTADAVIYKAKTRTLIVCDLKYGAGIAVDVEDNLQLKYYALGALIASDYPCEQVVIKIAQPRCFHPGGPVRFHVLPAMTMLDFASDVAKLAARTEDPNAEIVPGEWCRFCPAAGSVCPKLRETALELAKQEFTPQFSYDPEKLADTLRKLPALEAFIKQVNAFAFQEAQHGRCPPGFKLVQKRATRKWRDEKSAGADIVAQFDLPMDVAFEPLKLKSPAAIEKIVGKKNFPAELCIAESSGLTLAPLEDKRPAAILDGSEFSVITDQTKGNV